MIFRSGVFLYTNCSLCTYLLFEDLNQNANLAFTFYIYIKTLEQTGKYGTVPSFQLSRLYLSS